MLFCFPVASENHKDRDCLFVAMLSHGDEEGIYGTDYPIGYEELMAPFKECKSLVGKPKIFVVQVRRLWWATVSPVEFPDGIIRLLEADLSLDESLKYICLWL